MNIKIERPVRGGIIRAIASKSQAHRLLISSALADKTTFIKCAESSADIDVTIACLKTLGAGICRRDGGFYVEPIHIYAHGVKKILDCGESGSTLRFLIPVVFALGADAEFYMRGRLPERPVLPLLDELAKHGCRFGGVGETVLKCGGKLKCGSFELPGGISSQFISGLLFALPMLEGDSVLRVDGKEESRPYIDMTLDALRTFGIKIECGDGLYKIGGGQKYCSPGSVNVEGDWSNAAFWLCAGAFCAYGITCGNLRGNSRQGDREIIKLLERFGADVKCEGDYVTVSRAKLHGIRIDAGDTPDIVPVIAVVASAAEGETVIYNAGRLRIKESDRLAAVTVTLRALGANVSETGDGLKIVGGSKLKGGTVSSFGDHRIAMMAAVASGLCEGSVTIEGADAVNKSYPSFFEDFYALGGIAAKL